MHKYKMSKGLKLVKTCS